MDKLQKQLRSSLLENQDNQIKESIIWHLPVITYDVNYKPVKRSQQDILMKMMLLTFEQTEIRRAANLSELLLVEELFIADLLSKMQRMGLIRQEKEIYQLTSKGHEQLQTGIVVGEMEEESRLLSYSPFHDYFWPEMNEPLPETNEEWPLFRYVTDQNLINTDRILQVLAEKEDRLDEDGFQIVVADVTSFEQQKVEHVPCLEFQMYNKEQDIFFARVWNTWLKRWDDTLEKQIEEEERVEWREKWLVGEEGSE
jgi:DNA-binding PadR family transcriptional regulator